MRWPWRWPMAEQAPSAAAAPDGRAAVPPASTAAPALLPAAADGVELVAKFFRALGDPARLRLLEFLLPAEHTVSECVAHIGLSQGRVSVHLACLADCGYVQVRRSGPVAGRRQRRRARRLRPHRPGSLAAAVTAAGPLAGGRRRPAPRTWPV